ncbi:zinc finger CCCH domain-containing protein 18 isoform X2 [Tribolium madens]|uniref:zinc finger CCCH domain-containing protein 18 isoform X2 n=1 Tax=Tribolium madens TaxID=41895 RepID=UPI001CF736E4|nr:zinc finger CCCH domain-containing protein 18 isoform X2 [Tribolium madens]
MDSEDSRDASSDNESERKGPHSPASSRSRSRNSQAASVISRSASPQSGPESLSRSTSPEDSQSGPKSPASSRSGSPNSPENPPRSPPNGDGPRSPSPANSSRSSSPAGLKSPISNNGDKRSESRSSKHSISPDRVTNISDRSGSSRAKRSDNEDGNTSDSSVASVDSSSRKNKNITKNVDTLPEEISDGDMESDHEKEPEHKKEEPKNVRQEININHEDLSDVSDLDESIGGHSDDERDERKQNGETKKEDVEIISEKTRPEDGEEQLDFEAEDGECEMEEKKDKDEKDSGSLAEDGEMAEQREKEKEELEEGEVTDEDEVRPEETEPRPVCRFFSRGQCTWGASCRFLHPGVTDKGNYTMFELIRPVVPGEYGREERTYGRPEPAPVESAWERGLRTAKEMLRKSIKRKEQDIDFEEKKMNLSLAQEEFDKENGYYGRVASPEPRYVRHVPVEYPPVVRPPPTEEYYGRRQVIYEPDYVPPPPRERVRTYRELPSHRMPDFYNNKYEDEPIPATTKTRKPKREVIVQRAAEERPVRGDEWSDPWMRSKSPAGRKTAGRKRSYSSGSSYSSSRSSSESSRSSFRSRSRSHKRSSRSHRSRHVSPSVIVSERKAANERAALMNPPAPRKRAPSPGMMRVSATNPPAPLKEDQFGRTRSKMAIAAALARVKGRRRSSKSSSDSSGSSSSDSDSSGSSSSSSREESSPRRTSGVDISIAKAMDALKGSSSEKRQIKLNLKNPVGARKPEISDIARKTEALQGKKRPANSPPPLDPKSKKATSRREELLKQLKAVEDAIAKKRSKVN